MTETQMIQLIRDAVFNSTDGDIQLGELEATNVFNYFEKAGVLIQLESTAVDSDDADDKNYCGAV